jgi:hypothetical protein
MSNPDPQKILFSSRYKYFLNKTVEVGSLSIPAVSIPVFESRRYTLNIPIENVQNYSQIKMNFSHQSANWYVFPVVDITLDSNFTITVVGSYTGSNLVLNFFVVNQSAGTNTNTATDVSVRAYLFETPQ